MTLRNVANWVVCRAAADDLVTSACGQQSLSASDILLDTA